MKRKNNQKRISVQHQRRDKSGKILYGKKEKKKIRNVYAYNIEYAMNLKKYEVLEYMKKR